MQALFIGVICIITISICYIAITRTRLKNKSKELSEKLNHISSYSNKSNYEQARERLSALNNGAFIDIPSDLNSTFSGKIISATQEKDFVNHYKPHFQEAYSLVKKLEAFNITPSETIFNFISDFGAINRLVKQHNEGIITFLLDTHKEFFDHCLKYPLDKQQRRSIVSGEENCLVVSSAGSGKTSSIVGKVKYLTEIKKINPQNILLISYTNKAAAELTERMGIAGLRGYTFHKLALDIIGQTTGQKPSIYENTDALFVKIYHELLNDKKFKKSDAPDGFDVHFAPNPDILKTLAADRRPEQKVVGFAAESQNLEDSVRGKLVSKKADMVVGNLLQDGFGTPDNTVFVADASGREERWAHLSKTDVAWRLLSWLLSR